MLWRPTKRQQAHAWAFSGEVVGLGLSSAGNGLQAATHGHGNGPVIVAMTIPGLLFIALRVLTTVPATGWWRALLWPGFALLGIVFAVVSYRDQRSLLTTWEFDSISAALLPLGIDGLMVICAVALLALAALDLREAEDVALEPEPLVDLIGSGAEPTWGWRLADDGETMIAPGNPEPQPEVETSPVDDLVIPEPVFIEQPERERVDAETEARPARRRGKSPTQKEFERRLSTSMPMSPAEIMEKDGGTIRSAESKAYRWRKALQTEPVA